MSGLDPNAGGALVVPGGGASLSDATPAALGTAAAGVSTSASRADHVHAAPAAGGTYGAGTLAARPGSQELWLPHLLLATETAQRPTGPTGEALELDFETTVFPAVTVLSADTNGKGIVIIRHAGDLLTVYVGVSGMVVKKGDKVKRGQEIGKVAAGDPAFVHFEVRNTSKQSFDPVGYLQ